MLTREENQLIKIQTLYFFAGSLANVFLQVFLFNLAGFNQVVLFNLMNYLFLLIFYLISGWSLKKYSSATLIRIGLLFSSLGWLLLLLFKENAISILIPIGIIFGIGNGHYWSGFNLSQYIVTHKSRREHFFGKANGLINLAVSLGPFLGGLIISLGNRVFSVNYTGYYILFFIVLSLNLYNFLRSDLLPTHRGIKFSLQHVWQHQRSYNWLLVLIQQFVAGMYDVAFSVFSGVLIYLIVRSENLLGIVNSITSLVTAIFCVIAGKLLVKHSRLSLLGAMGIALGVFIFAVQQNWLGLIVMCLLIATTAPFLNIKLATSVLNTIDENREHWQNKYHLFLERDSVLGISRVISFAILHWLLIHFDKTIVAKNWTMAIAIFPLILGWLVYKMKADPNKSI